jgi:hypothetical protein
MVAAPQEDEEEEATEDYDERGSAVGGGGDGGLAAGTGGIEPPAGGAEGGGGGGSVSDSEVAPTKARSRLGQTSSSRSGSESKLDDLAKTYTAAAAAAKVADGSPASPSRVPSPPAAPGAAPTPAAPAAAAAAGSAAAAAPAAAETVGGDGSEKGMVDAGEGVLDDDGERLPGSSLDFRVQGRVLEDKTLRLRLKINDSSGHQRTVEFPFNNEVGTDGYACHVIRRTVHLCFPS